MAYLKDVKDVCLHIVNAMQMCCYRVFIIIIIILLFYFSWSATKPNKNYWSF